MHQIIKDQSIKVIIFDMDGVLVNSEHWWSILESRFLRKQIGKWTKEDQASIKGCSLKDIYQILKDQYNLKMEWNQFWQCYEQMAKQIYQEKSSLMFGVKQVLKALKQRGFKQALASSSARSWINMFLNRFSLERFFDIIVSAEEVNDRAKPRPDIYLYIANRLEVQTKSCLVVEDSKNGILAAKCADMLAIGYRTLDNKDQDLSQADNIINNLQEII